MVKTITLSKVRRARERWRSVGLRLADAARRLAVAGHMKEAEALSAMARDAAGRVAVLRESIAGAGSPRLREAQAAYEREAQAVASLEWYVEQGRKALRERFTPVSSSKSVEDGMAAVVGMLGDVPIRLTPKQRAVIEEVTGEMFGFDARDLVKPGSVREAGAATSAGGLLRGGKKQAEAPRHPLEVIMQQADDDLTARAMKGDQDAMSRVRNRNAAKIAQKALQQKMATGQALGLYGSEGKVEVEAEDIDQKTADDEARNPYDSEAEDVMRLHADEDEAGDHGSHAEPTYADEEEHGLYAGGHHIDPDQEDDADDIGAGLSDFERRQLGLPPTSKQAEDEGEVEMEDIPMLPKGARFPKGARVRR